MESENSLGIIYICLLSSTLGYFITSILSTLRNMVDNYTSEFISQMMTYDPDLTISSLSQETIEMDNPVFLGAKAYFLKKLISYNFPIPPGFVLTTEVFRHKDNVQEHPYIVQELEQLYLKPYLGSRTTNKSTVWESEKSLLFSFRSGSAFPCLVQ